MIEQVFSAANFSPQAAVLGNGEFLPMEIVGKWLSRVQYVVCCDGAAAQADAHGIVPDAIVGDGDSISDAMRAKYADILHFESEQEFNDQTKAVRFLVKRGINRIVILCSAGKREDHALGNISLLTYYLQHGIMAVMPTPYGIFVPCKDCASLETEVGQQVSVFNISATGIKSQNLKYDCYDFTMLWQGTLNEATDKIVRISASGYYLVYLANI